MTINPVPAGYHTVTPYLTVQNVTAQIEFLKHAFNAVEVTNTTLPDGKIINAEIKIGDSMLMVAPLGEGLPPTPASFYLYVEDADAVYRHSILAGAVSIMEPSDTFYGDRNAGVKDAFGNSWWIATHVEDVLPDEVQKRAAERLKNY